MKKTSFYYGRMNNLINNALLHLYMSIESSGQYCPVPKRNAILVKFIKPKLKDLAYKYVKGEVKLLVLAGREKQENLERKLYSLKKLISNHYNSLNNITKLYELIQLLSRDHHIECKIMNRLEDFDPSVINFRKSELDKYYLKSNSESVPLLLSGSFDNIENLYSIILDTNLFSPHLNRNEQHTPYASIVLNNYIA